MSIGDGLMLAFALTVLGAFIMLVGWGIALILMRRITR